MRQAPTSRPGVPFGEIILQQLILLVGCPRLAGFDDQILVAPDQLALGVAGTKFIGQHPHRDTGLAIQTTGAIGDILAAAEPDPAQRIVQFFGMGTVQFGKHLAFASLLLQS